MPLPPDPKMPALLLAVAAKMTWRSVAGAHDAAGAELGYLIDGGATRAFYLDRGETWGVYDSTAPGLGPFLLSRTSFDVLQGGTLSTDGTIAFEGRSFRIRATYESGHLCATAIAA